MSKALEDLAANLAVRGWHATLFLAGGQPAVQSAKPGKKPRHRRP